MHILIWKMKYIMLTDSQLKLSFSVNVSLLVLTFLIAVTIMLMGNFADFQPALHHYSVGSICKWTTSLPPVCLHPELPAHLPTKVLLFGPKIILPHFISPPWETTYRSRPDGERASHQTQINALPISCLKRFKKTKRDCERESVWTISKGHIVSCILKTEDKIIQI